MGLRKGKANWLCYSKNPRNTAEYTVVNQTVHYTVWCTPADMTPMRSLHLEVCGHKRNNADRRPMRERPLARPGGY